MKIKPRHSFTASVACKFRKISMGKCDWKAYSNLVDLNKNPLMESFPPIFTPASYQVFVHIVLQARLFWKSMSVLDTVERLVQVF